MSPLPLLVRILLVGLLILGAGLVSGQTTSTGSGQAYPNKPIRVVSTEAGGSGDFVVRLLAQGPQGLSALLGQPVIVDNRSGGIIPMEIVVKAPPDGYTVLVIGASFWLSPLFQKMPYDPVKDFLPITLMISQPYVLVVNPALPAKSVKELIALAKAKPGELNYGFTIPGTSVHIASELINSMAGVNIVRIPYKGVAQALNALIGGELQVMVSPVAAAMPHVKSGRLRALAVTSAQPSALVPGYPTVAASGLPGYEAGNANGMFAPAKTPAAVINRLNQEIVRALNRPDVKEKLLNSGVEPVGSSPGEFADVIKAEMSRVAKMIKDGIIRAE